MYMYFLICHKNLKTILFILAFKLHFKKIPSLLWQYYISSDGAHFEYPAYQLGYNQHCELKTDRHR